ncbi:hypothetical protein FKZ61_010290 [Litorilinea aerophila]|uniref:Uncharacterized protein n=1 Tax=Litorilinea aerophila TaxID=1204385 RepID=A0A540VGB6_9CHLR|nr:hypothetical protein [Litorilinea aerophila]MCC9076497.1 hypothetical protein [Litorilinea aerophila]OUC07064.1 hypothetical protein RY27_17175 [Litorilinea aerophila]
MNESTHSTRVSDATSSRVWTEIRQRMEERRARVRRLQRKARLASLGLLGLALDTARTACREGQDWLDRAEARGEALEQELHTRLQAMGPCGRAVDELLTCLGMAPAARQPAEIPIAPAETPPFPDYDDLTAPEILQRLDALDADGLARLRRYEAAHKQRVTILRAVDERLGGNLKIED